MKLLLISGLLVFILLITLAYADSALQGLAPRIHAVDILEPIPIQDAIGRDELRLTCSSSGSPVPKLEWSFNGVVFVKDVPHGKNTVARHKMEGTMLTITPISGIQDTGRYRCIATNDIGSVFLEKYINIRVLGVFNPGATRKDEMRKLYPTVGRAFAMTCPPHRTGYGTKYKWGVVQAITNSVEYYVPTIPIKHAFPMGKKFQYAFISNDDIKRSKDTGGLQCILVNAGTFQVSVKQVLWNPYATRLESRKPDLVLRLKPQMVAVVNSEYSMLCGAKHNPMAKISWQYQGQGVRSRWLNNSMELNFEFYRLLAGGHRLSIRRVTRYSGGSFKCFADNALGRVWSVGQLTVHFPPKWLMIFPDQVNVPVGNSYQINCSASGVPLPKYEWYHNGTRIKNSLFRQVEKGLLTIKQSRYSDDGIYICLAISYLDTLSQSTYIIVQAMKPTFTVPVNNPIYLFRTYTMYVDCQVTGGPPPKITWFKSLTELKDRERPNEREEDFKKKYLTMSDGRLRIRDVDNVTDKAEFKCVAINKHGKVESAGFSDIVEPTVISHPPANLTYQVGWPYLNIFCGASYDKRLDLRIEWYKSGVRMMKFDDHIFTEGRASGAPRILYINDVTVHDRGLYTCHAYTKIGDVISEDHKTGRLRIKGPPEPPAGMIIQIKGSCRHFKAKLEWLRGEELEAPTRRFYIEFKTNTSKEWFTGHKPGEKLFAEPGTITYFILTNETLPPGANLIFRARAASDHLIGRPSAHSKVGSCVTPKGRPLINPWNVSSVANETGTLYIKWKPVTDVYYGSDGFYYKVAYKLQEEAKFTIKNIHNPHASMLEVDNPGVGKLYDFYVQSVNDKGNGPTPVIYSNYSGKLPPVSRPYDFRVDMILRFTVELRWTPVENAEAYRVSYCNLTDSESQRGHTPPHFGNKRKRRFVDSCVIQNQLFTGKEFMNGAPLSNLTADQEFYATVAAVNSGGVGPESQSITFTTQSRVPGVPIKVKFQTYGGSARLQWNPPVDPNGYIEEYRIIWYTTDPHDRSATGVVTTVGFLRPKREAYLIDTFKPLVYYTIKLQARNRIGPGKDWEKQLMAVSVDDIPGKPFAPIATPFDDTSINITFVLSNYGGFPTMFRVLVRERGFYYRHQVIYEQAFPKRTWILVKGLKFVTYDFHCVAINKYGQSETSDVTEQRPIRRPNRQNRAPTFQWWRSNYFILMALIVAFLVLMGLTIALLIRRKKTVLYARLPEGRKKKRVVKIAKKRRGTTVPTKFALKDLRTDFFSKKGKMETKVDSVDDLEEPPPYRSASMDEIETGVTTALIAHVPESRDKSVEKTVDVDEEKKSNRSSGSSYTESGSESESTSTGSSDRTASDSKYSDDESSKYSVVDYASESSSIKIAGNASTAAPEVAHRNVKVAQNVQNVTYPTDTPDVARNFFI